MHFILHADRKDKGATKCSKHGIMKWSVLMVTMLI